MSVNLWTKSERWPTIQPLAAHDVGLESELYSGPGMPLTKRRSFFVGGHCARTNLVLAYKP